jgi:dihydroneopterin aldolase
MNAFKLYIDGLRVSAIIGILDFERESEQNIVIDAVIEYFKDGDHFVNYKYVAETIESNLKKREYGLIEDALKDIMIRIKEDYPMISSIRMKISKPDILENCVVGVERYKKY